MTEDEFKAGIRRAIYGAFMDGGNTVAEPATTVRSVDDAILFIEGEIDIAALADEVHAFVVETLSPPFGKTHP